MAIIIKYQLEYREKFVAFKYYVVAKNGGG